MLIFLFVSQVLYPWKHKALYWEFSQIELSVVSPELERPLREAMDLWNQVPCLKFHFLFNSASSNVVSVHMEAGWPYEPEALGMTIYRYDGFSKVIDSVRIELNCSRYRWSYMDYKNVLLHELGHVLGLEHSSDITSVMWPYARLGDPEHTLSQDDIEGVCGLSPIGPGGKYKGPMLEQRVPEKSGCSQNGHGSFMVWLAAGLLLMLRQYGFVGKTVKNKRGE